MTPQTQVDLESSDQPFSWQGMADAVALTLVNQTFERMKTYRYQNHDQRWNNADALYFGWMPQRYWEGSKVPRSSISIPITFDQVEAAMPIVTGALFNQSKDWFEVEPQPGGDLKGARAAQQRLSYLLETPRDRVGNCARNEIQLAIKSLMLYGNGGVAIEPDAATGDPTVRWVDIRDIFIDPGTRTPLVDDSRSVIERRFLTVEQLETLRQTEGMKLPAKEVLVAMSRNRPMDASDNTKQVSEALRGVAFRPGFDDYAEIAPDRSIEVLCYWTEKRNIWVLNREWACYNDTNPYGFIPYAFAPCYTVLGRFYAMGYADVLEGNQRYIQGITNARIDELTLSLNPPRFRKRGPALLPSQARWRPGLMVDLENPKEDMLVQQSQNVTNNSWQEVQYLEATAEKRTGVNSMVTQGMPMRSNASRTAAGVNAQMEGPTSRLRSIVESVENYLIVPMLHKLLAMDQHHNGASSTPLNGLHAGQITQLQPQDLSGPVRFRISASSRMLTQGKLTQLVPFLSQYLLNGAFLSQLSKSGQTVDFSEFFGMIQDATGTKDSYALVRPLTDDEKKAMSQPSPQDQMRMQMAQQSNQVRTTIAQTKAQTEMSMHMSDAQVQQRMQEEEMAFKLLGLLHDLDQSRQMGGMPVPAQPDPTAAAGA